MLQVPMWCWKRPADWSRSAAAPPLSPGLRMASHPNSSLLQTPMRCWRSPFFVFVYLFIIFMFSFYFFTFLGGDLLRLELAQSQLCRYCHRLEQLLIWLVHRCECPCRVGETLRLELASYSLRRSRQFRKQLLISLVHRCKCPCRVCEVLLLLLLD